GPLGRAVRRSDRLVPGGLASSGRPARLKRGGDHVLLSMTGYGEARLQDDRWAVSVEVRTVNNRHLKVNAKVTEPYRALEPELERLVRETIRRGTVNLQIRVERPRRPEDYRINTVALASYRDQVEAVQGAGAAPLDLSALLLLPGVI